MIDVISALKQVQNEEGLTDKELADKVGVNRVSWGRIKSRGRYSKRFLKGARAAFPSLFLPTNASSNGNVG